jgi:hypothetical protein
VRLPHGEATKFALDIEIARPRRPMKPATVSGEIANVKPRHGHVLGGVWLTIPIRSISLPDRAVAVLQSA